MNRDVIRQEVQEFHEGGISRLQKEFYSSTGGHRAGYEQILSPGNIPV